MKKKNKEIKLTYHYIEPKTPEEKAEAQRCLDGVFDILFKEVEKRRAEQKSENV